MSEAALELFDILDAQKIKYYRQGSAPHKLPDHFYTFWEIDQDPVVPMDDDYRATVSLFGIYYYDNDIKRLYTEPSKLVGALEEAGWTISMLPHDFAADGLEYCRYFQVMRMKTRNT